MRMAACGPVATAQGHLVDMNIHAPAAGEPFDTECVFLYEEAMPAPRGEYVSSTRLSSIVSHTERSSSMKRMGVVVHEFTNEIEAELAKGCLESAGIDAAIMKDDAGSMFPSLQGTEGVQLLVSPDDEEEARSILEVKSSPLTLLPGNPRA